MPTPAELVEAGGPDARLNDAFGITALDVASARWGPAADALRALGYRYLDWLSAYEDGESYVVATFLFSLEHRTGLLLRTRVPRAEPTIVTLTDRWPGADWHERETREMFGITFEGHPNPAPLLLPDGFEGHPLRKDFVLAARRRPWPGAQDPDPAAASGRRKLVPPGPVAPPEPPA